MKECEYYLKQCYERAVADSNNFTDFASLLDFMWIALCHNEESKFYVDILESELLNRDLISHKIQTRQDFINMRRWERPDFNRMLYYISLVRDPIKY